MTRAEQIQRILAICPEFSEELARYGEFRFRQGYGHGVTDVGTPEQADAAAEWRATTAYGDGASRFDYAVKPPCSNGSESWVERSLRFHSGSGGAASPLIDGLLMAGRQNDLHQQLKNKMSSTPEYIEPDFDAQVPEAQINPATAEGHGEVDPPPIFG